MTLSRRSFLGLAGAFCLPACTALPFSQKKPKIIVIGGGYGGATCAKYLKLSDPSLDVTLIEKKSRYLSCPGSNQVIAGWHELPWLARSYSGLDKSIRLIHAKVVQINAAQRSIQLEDGTTLNYDRLVVSVGIDLNFDAIPGYDHQASRTVPHAWKAGRQTLMLKNQLRAMKDGGSVIITVPENPYRCPPGPYERASLIASYLKAHKPKSKILILDAKSKFSKQALFMEGWARLCPGMIEWIALTQEGAIEKINAQKRTVNTEFSEYQADVLNVIPPQKAGRIAQNSGLTDSSGWCPIAPNSFASTLQKDIYVIGDACIASPMPKSAFSANNQAKVCAKAIVDELKGQPIGSPFLINHCYSFLSEDYAISITGVYEYSKQQLIATASGETPMDANRKQEADFARSWLANITADSFG